MENSTDILLIEDNPNDVELTLRALRKHNPHVRVDVLRDGAEALDTLFDEETPLPLPRMILLDLKLPKVDGLEVLRHLKTNERTQSIPVVALTTSREESDIKSSYRLGVNSYIAKPVDFEEFSEAVKDLGRYWLTWNEHGLS